MTAIISYTAPRCLAAISGELPALFVANAKAAEAEVMAFIGVANARHHIRKAAVIAQSSRPEEHALTPDQALKVSRSSSMAFRNSDVAGTTRLMLWRTEWDHMTRNIIEGRNRESQFGTEVIFMGTGGQHNMMGITSRWGGSKPSSERVLLRRV
jgi:hypothetical protein